MAQIPASDVIHPLTGAILAGGLSTRMGQNKAMLRLRDGRPMLEHVAEAMKGVCDRIVIVGKKTPGQAGGYSCIEDLRPQSGPLGGIEALLTSGVDPRGQYLVCPCDVPLISAAILKLLISPSDRPATIFHIEGRPAGENEPLPARISAEALPTVRQLLNAGRRSVWMLMKELRPQIVTIPSEQTRQLHNVNSEDDFRGLRSQ